MNGRLPLYTRDGPIPTEVPSRVNGTDDIVVTPSDVAVRSVHAVKATAAQWAVVQVFRLVPDANVVLREHVLSSKRHQDSASLTVFGVLVTKPHGPFVLRREYVVDDLQQAAVVLERASWLCLTAEFDRRRFRSSLAVAVLATPSRRPT